MLRRLLFVTAVLLGPPAVAQADQPTLDDLYIDFSPPDLTAFTLVGVEAGRVARPGTVKALAASLANGLSPDGAAEQGVGLEVTPALLFRGGRPVQRYHGSTERFSLSAASLRAGDSTRIGIGLRWVPIDGADPLDDPNTPEGTQLRSAIGKALAGVNAAVREELGPQQGAQVLRVRTFVRALRARLGLDDEAQEALAEALEASGDIHALPAVATREAAFEKALAGRMLTAAERDTASVLLTEYGLLRTRVETLKPVIDGDLAAAVKQAEEAYREATWNAPALQLALGTTWRAGNDLDELESEGLQAFASGAFGVGRRFQAVGYLRGQALAGPTGIEFGGRVLVGSATRRLSAEGLYATGDLVEGDGWRVLLGGELRLADGTFLELATGLNLPETGEVGLRTLGGLRYALRPKPRYTADR